MYALGCATSLEGLHEHPLCVVLESLGFFQCRRPLAE